MRKLKERFSGLTLIKVLIYMFLGLFMLLPLFSVFVISFTDDPINILGSFTDPAIFSSTIDKLKGVSLDNYKDIFSNVGYLDALKTAYF